jgi:hypothetical protein
MRSVLVCALLLTATAIEAERTRAVRVTVVPEAYKPLWIYLDAHLEGLERYLETRSVPADHRLMLGGEVMPANPNRGAALLAPEAMAGVRVYLEAMQRLGADVANVGIAYPLFDPSFPRSAEYIAFYKSVAEEVRRRGMKLSVETGVVFAGTPFADVNVDFSTLTFDQYRQAKRAMAHTIVRELSPDYLGLVAEPDTEAALTGLDQLNDPVAYRELVNYILQGLDRGGTMIGAGVGTWGDLRFVNEFVRTSIDYVDVHHYPTWTVALQNLVVIAQTARAAGKRLTLDETWLYKATAAEDTSIAANEEIFRRDAFSFWWPLDAKFLRLIAQLARAERFDYISPFWTTYFFGSVDFTGETANLAYRQLTERVNRTAVENLLAGRTTPLGEEYKRLK